MRNLQRTEVREVEEPFGKGQKGSSAMPHKRNPITTERITGLARVLRGYAQAGLENVALWHERDISHSGAERVILPDATIGLDYMQHLGTRVASGMTVHAERMTENLELTHGAIFSQRALTALIEAGMVRDDAYRLVQENAQRAWDERTPFRGLLAAALEDGEVAGRPRRGLRPERLPGRGRGRLRAPRGAQVATAARSLRDSHHPGARRPAAVARFAAMTTLSELPLHSSGKVREIYESGEDELIMVASDRISAFDVIMAEPIPDKGKVLTQMSVFWFDTTGEIVPNHLIDQDVPDEVAGRALRVQRLTMYPVECVVRGYITGSGWKEYQRDGSVCGIELPDGLRESDQLPEPIFTPATKAEIGEHDENIDFDRAAEIIGSRPLMEELRRVSIELYEHARTHALEPRDHPRRHQVRVRLRRPGPRWCSATRC